MDDTTNIKGCDLKIVEKKLADKYNIDSSDTVNNQIILDTSLMEIEEEENNTNNASSTFCGSGYIKIRYTVYSSNQHCSIE